MDKMKKMQDKKVDIAVIDSGICDSEILTGKVTAKIEFPAAVENRGDVPSGQSSYVHGTTCAEIINSICPNVHFLDLMAMQPDGTAQISKLLEALDWCLYQGVKLIHLSLGTVNYFDVKPLEKRVISLQKQKVSIVAAYHNHNIRTYPAAFPGVFGVRQDREGILEENQFLFQNQAGYSQENTIVAHWWGKDGNQRANSYAAPVITGYIARALLENGEVDFRTVSEFLRKDAIRGRQYQGNIENVICTSGDAIEYDKSVNIPVIAVVGVCREEMRGLANGFESKGFQTLLLQENATDVDAIPMEYYKEKGGSLGQTLYTVEIIYKPDIIFLDFLSEKIFDEIDKSEIDMLISRHCEVYTITAEGLLRTTEESGEIQDIICRYF